MPFSEIGPEAVGAGKTTGRPTAEFEGFSETARCACIVCLCGEPRINRAAGLNDGATVQGRQTSAREAQPGKSN
jgi:hypothetical protein